MAGRSKTVDPPGGHYKVTTVNDNTGMTREIGFAHFWPSGTLIVSLDAMPANGELRIELPLGRLELPPRASVPPVVDSQESTLLERVKKAVENAPLGQFDGAHHKDWVIQEMIKDLHGWSESQLLRWLNEVQWPRGVAP
jgi:hypothetical protein